jgi:hypothetical protein
MTERYAVRMDQTASQDIEGESVVINFETYHYYGLNRTATAIWKLLFARPCDREELTAWIAGAYRVPAASVSADVERLMDVLVAEGLVEVVDAAAAGSPGAPGDATLSGDGSYEAPRLDKHDKLDQLMLSGE